ncbi:DUF3973 domain-containing protein [Ammoniphilus sp. 3BR4]|uniref:DUF3973 domain-containing protein n=1 Tax=Ammoniphilus sp. 3BR4 TaxID=3158265 RepID=UPI0034676D02
MRANGDTGEMEIEGKMYFCIKCGKLHLDNKTEVKIFSTGYTLLNEEKVPLGICTLKLLKEEN